MLSFPTSQSIPIEVKKNDVMLNGKVTDKSWVIKYIISLGFIIEVHFSIN